MSLYAAGIVIAPDGGAFVAIEKRPRKTGRTRDTWYDGVREREDIWEDVLRIVGAERLTGTVPDMVGQVARRLTAEPMLNDTVAYVDTTILGAPLTRLFYDHRCWPHGIVVAGEQEVRDTKSGIVTVPVRALQALVTMTLQSKQLEVVDRLPTAALLLRSIETLETLPSSGPTRDLAIAAAIALWTAHQYRSHGPWASNKPAPVDSTDEWAREARRQAILRARRALPGRPWWADLTDSDDR